MHVTYLVRLPTTGLLARNHFWFPVVREEYVNSSLLFIVTSTESQLFNQVVPNDSFPSDRLPTRKGGVLLHFNHIPTASTGWRAQDLFESLTFTSRDMYHLVAEI